MGGYLDMYGNENTWLCLEPSGNMWACRMLGLDRNESHTGSLKEPLQSHSCHDLTPWGWWWSTTLKKNGMPNQFKYQRSMETPSRRGEWKKTYMMSMEGRTAPTRLKEATAYELKFAKGHFDGGQMSWANCKNKEEALKDGMLLRPVTTGRGWVRNWSGPYPLQSTGNGGNAWGTCWTTNFTICHLPTMVSCKGWQV